MTLNYIIYCFFILDSIEFYVLVTRANSTINKIKIEGMTCAKVYKAINSTEIYCYITC